MLTLHDHDDWRTLMADVAVRAQAGEQVGLRLHDDRSRIARGVVEACDGAVLLHVPRSVDQTERLLLSLGTALGPNALEAADTTLRQTPDDLSGALETFQRELGDRPLVVDGWETLGDFGPDSELGSALRQRASMVRRWLEPRASVFLGSMLPATTAVMPLPDTPPVQLMNGKVLDTHDRWEALAHDPAAYQLELTARALGARDHDEPTSRDNLRALILDELPREAARLLRQLAAHARPLALRLARALGDSSLALGRDLGLWSQIGDEIVLNSGWAEHIRHHSSPAALAQLHTALANEFQRDVRPEDPSAAQRGLSILEAHRHLVAAGDVEGAQVYWRYGASLLIEAARARSLDGDYRAAAQLYGVVITAADGGRLALPTRLRGYTRHYLHFNRAHGNLELFPATARGYVQALSDWPENALFWSRLIRTHCLTNHFGQANEALNTAQSAVPPHRRKQTSLIARTVRGLLKHGHLLDAVRIWGDYQANTPFGNDVARHLETLLHRGWSTKDLTLVENEPLSFLRTTHVQVRRRGVRWVADLPGLDAFIYGRGASPLDALTELVRSLRNKVIALIRAHTPDLSPQDRMHKRLLLGRVDVVTSRLDAASLPSHWYAGTLSRDENEQVWLNTGGVASLSFEVSESLLDALDDRDYLAEVATDDRGTPVGPILSLEPACSESAEALWAAWHARVAHVG